MLRKDITQLSVSLKQSCTSGIVTPFKSSRNVFCSRQYVNRRSHSGVSSRLCHVRSSLSREQSSFRNWTAPLFKSCYTTNRDGAVTMTSRSFKGRNDHYNGVTIDSKEEPCEPEDFAQRLDASLEQWLKDGKRAVWFRVHLPHAGWVPMLVKEEFKFHHAQQEYVMLYRWLPSDQKSNIPPYAHTNLGVGAFVYNEETNELLVIKEKYSSVNPLWKLPGGYVEPGENMEDAAKREVLEETGVQTAFKCLVAFRHGHGYAFNCSDIYMIAYLHPVTFDIQKCKREISECRWMKLNEYSEHPEVHENNRAFARKMLDILRHKMGLTADYALHPISKKPICVYSISNLDTALSKS